MRKLLVVFDFDHTVVDDNTDTAIVQGVTLPQEVASKYAPGGWTAYMNAVLRHLHSSEGFDMVRLQRTLCAIPLTPGMRLLLEHLAQHPDMYDAVIASDSNSLFINWILDHQGLGHVFRDVFTNPAEVAPEGWLAVEHHHVHGCVHCPPNMCKQQILLQQMHQGCDNGTACTAVGLGSSSSSAGGSATAARAGRYSRVMYVGDGSNDYCPALAMSADDVLFVRRGYRLEQLLLLDEAKRAALRCGVHFWQDAGSILEWLLANVHVTQS